MDNRSTFLTSGEGVPPQGGRSEEALATVYQKHRSPLSRKTMYGGWRLPSAGRLRKPVSVSEAGDWSPGERRP